MEVWCLYVGDMKAHNGLLVSPEQHNCMLYRVLLTQSTF